MHAMVTRQAEHMCPVAKLQQFVDVNGQGHRRRLGMLTTWTSTIGLPAPDCRAQGPNTVSGGDNRSRVWRLAAALALGPNP